MINMSTRKQSRRLIVIVLIGLIFQIILIGNPSSLPCCRCCTTRLWPTDGSSTEATFRLPHVGSALQCRQLQQLSLGESSLP
jgi:hypothetical protein